MVCISPLLIFSSPDCYNDIYDSVLQQLHRSINVCKLKLFTYDLLHVFVFSYLLPSDQDCVCLVGAAADVTTTGGNFTLRKMFSDLQHRTYSSDAGGFGTLKWQGNVQQNTGGHLRAIKVYSTYIHYLKATQPISLLHLPSTGKTLRARWTQLGVLAGRTWPTTVNQLR